MFAPEEPASASAEATEATTTNDDPVAFQRPELTFKEEPVSISSVRADRSSRPDNLFRSAKWCPDGSCVLTHEEDRLLKIYPLKQQPVGDSQAPYRPYLRSLPADQVWKPYLSLPRAPAALLGAEWFPYASSQWPEMFCFVRSIRDLPVSLVDGNSGKIRASYSIIDHQERFIGPQCMTFSLDTTKLYCGFEGAIECFDIVVPGNTGRRWPLSPSRKSRQGQKGIISTISLAPDQSGLMAAGSFARSTCLYDASGGEPRLLRSLKSRDHRGAGVTQVKFHPTSPELLYTASRCSDAIVVWDVRNPKEPLMAHERKGSTNQKIAFDIDVWGKWLVTGDTDGNVAIFDTQDPEGSNAVKTYKVARDTVSSASLHPYLPYLLTTSGSRQADPQISSALEASDTDSEFSMSDSESDEDDDQQSAEPPEISARPQAESRLEVAKLS